MAKRIAIVGMVLGVSWPISARAQFSTSAPTDSTAGGEVDTNVGGTGHPGRIGIGITSHGRGTARNVAAIIPGDVPQITASGIGSLSGKLFVGKRLAVQLLLGTAVLKSTSYQNPLARAGKTESKGFLVMVGPRLLYSAVRGDNAELYIGGGVDFLYGDTTIDPEGSPAEGGGAQGATLTAWVISVPFGFEFGFPGVPAVRLSAEMAVSFVTASFEYHLDTGADVEREELGSAKAFILGSPGLDFLTLGIHYYF